MTTRQRACSILTLLVLFAAAVARGQSVQPVQSPSFEELRRAHAAAAPVPVAKRQPAPHPTTRRRVAPPAAAPARPLAASASPAVPAPQPAPRRDTAIVAVAATIAAHDTVRHAPATPAPVVASPAVPEAVVRTADATPPAAPASPSAVKAPTAPTAPVVTGLLQLWAAGGDAGYRGTMRVRRAEVRVSGVASPRVSWSVMLDIAKALSMSATTTPAGTMQVSMAQGSRALQDAVLMLQALPAARVDVGQQKIPFGIEGFQSSASLPTVERALFASDRARGGGFGDTRDVGVSVRGRVLNAVDYHAGVYDGSGEGQNDVDANVAKSVAAHLAVTPLSHLLLGASVVRAGRGAGDAPVRDRLGLELQSRGARWLLQGEAVSGRDGTVDRRGMYAHAGVRATPALDLHARFDAWDPDQSREEDAASATERDYLAGATWQVPRGPLKAQLDLTRRTYSAALLPSRWLLSLNLQSTW